MENRQPGREPVPQQTNPDVIRRWREVAFVLVVLVPLAVIMAFPPIPQNPNYHVFADGRTVIGIPNFLDVATNIAFLVVGVAGVLLCFGKTVDGATRSWAVFFLGTALTFLGSAYYHWTPNSETLIWDRLPITIAFMGLFSGLVSEHVGLDYERAILAPALAVGIASVAWWHYTDDLRVYVWVQGAPLLAIVFVLIAFPGKYTHRSYLAYGLVSYLVAKVAELQDREIFALTAQAISGHVLKHLLAALAVFFVYLMLRRRAPLVLGRR